MAGTSVINDWKKLVVEYTHQGKRVKEEAYLTIDLNEHQIVVLPTAGFVIAQQRFHRVNLKTLREQAVANIGRIARKEPVVLDE